MTKAELRRVFSEKRASLAGTDAAELSRQTATSFFTRVDLSGVSTIHTFIPHRKFNEVDSSLIYEKLWSSFPNIAVASSRTDAASGGITSHLFGPTTELIPGKWGIPEPSGSARIAPERIDMALVPLLCFDERGHRVGYGKGIYDRFLSSCRSDCVKVGLSFFPPITRIEDVSDHDIALDCCVTPDKLYRF